MDGETFRCDICQARQDDDLLCKTTSDKWSVFCVHCCSCPQHSRTEVDGTVIFSGAPLTWRGLGSEHQTRRHQ